MIRKKKVTPKPKDAKPPVDSILDHKDGCDCERCKGLEKCPRCERIKLDIDYCFACKALVM